MEKFVLPPGFRFHPTDEELLSHYLRRKVCGRKIDFEAIAEVDLYNYEPWDLPEKSFLQTRDLEWYFFIPRDRKYPNGSRTNRATEKGYWKSTGKDRLVSSGSRNVGTKKTLVYYNGRAPKGERTNWVMHEYRLNDAECQRVNAENGFVLCRIYQKSGAGPKNGEQYGAPVEDEEFENSPPVEGSGGGFFKDGPFDAGPSSVGDYYVPSPTSRSRIETVSHEVNKVDPNAGIQPHNMKFLESLGSMTSDFCKMENVTNQYGTGSTVYGVEDSGAPGCLEEDKLLQELYKLVESNDQLESTDGYQDPMTCVETAFYQPGAHPPRDGDFLELNDLLSVSDCEDFEAIKSNKTLTNGGLKDFSGGSECSSLPQLQAIPMSGVSERSGQWRNLPFGDVMHEKQQNIPGSMQMQSSVSTVTYDSQYQPFRGDLLDSLTASSDLFNEELGVACQTDSVEPDVEYVVKLFERAKEDKSFNAESFAENIQRELFHAEDNSLIPSQDGWDGQYYDAPLSFTDIDMYGESRSTAMHTASNFGTPQMTLMQASLTSKVDGVLDKLAVDSIDSTEHFEGFVEPHDFVTESFLLSQGDGITSGQVKHPPSPLSILWSCLDSLPTLPASAADLSPKAVSPGRSIRVTATGVGVGAVSVTCTCVGDDMPSSCMNCSVAEVKNTGRFVKSLSLVGQRSKTSDKWRIGYYTSAVFGGLWAVFWLLIAGGAWKLFGGVIRRMVASET